MTTRPTVLAVFAILGGCLASVATGTGLLGAMLVAGGAYALILPEFVQHRSHATESPDVATVRRPRE